MSHERVDEAIDRIAKALTAVPADPGFSARLSVRLERRSWNLMPRLLAASSAAVLIVVTLGMFRPTTGGPELLAGRSGEPATSRGGLPTDARRDAPAPDAPAPLAPGAPAPAAPLTPLAPLTPTGAPTTPDASDSPAALQVEILTVEPLTNADVNVTPLDVASLEIEDIDGSGEPKEPK